jgi:RimJ/RimL family protein N-acetyltransferase
MSHRIDPLTQPEPTGSLGLSERREAPKASIDLFWLPLGAGGWFVRMNGRIYEAMKARLERRRPLDLYHSALEVRVPEGRFVIEISWPIPDPDGESRGVVVARRARRYERRWPRRASMLAMFLHASGSSRCLVWRGCAPDVVRYGAEDGDVRGASRACPRPVRGARTHRSEGRGGPGAVVPSGILVMAEVALRERIDADLGTLFEFQADPEASAMAAFPSRDLPAFLEREARIKADPSNIKRTIVAGGEVVGWIGSWEVEGERDVGFWIGRDHWGNGYATAALRAFLEVDLHRPLHAHVVDHNVGSRRVLEKCGFVLDHSTQEEDVLEHVLVLTD